jgi:hypothetical protein
MLFLGGVQTIGEPEAVIMQSTFLAPAKQLEDR